MAGQKLDNEYKEEEWEEPLEGTKWPKEKRREYLKKLIVDIGLYNVNKKELAEKFGVNRNQVYLDIKALVKGGLDPDKVKHATIEIDGALTKAQKEMHSLLLTGTPAQKIQAAKVLSDTAGKVTDFLERFGFKEKVADKHEVTGLLFDVSTPLSPEEKADLLRQYDEYKKRGKKS